MRDGMVDVPEIDDVLLRDRLEQRAAAEPAAPFLAFKDTTYTIGDINQAANRLANALLYQGLRPGDRLGIMLPNHPDHIVAIFAALKAGLVRVPVNIHAKGPSLQHYFDAFELAALIANVDYVDVLDDVFKERAPVRTFWRGGPGNFEKLAAFADDSAPAIALSPDDIVTLTPSSGTTGAPKGVLKSDRTLRAGPVCVIALTEARRGDVFFLWEPLHHGAGVAVVIGAVLGGYSLAMVEKFSASRFWEQVVTHGVTHIHYLGGVVPLLLKQPPSPLDKAHKVRLAWGGGCPPELWEELETRFGVEIREGYGLSELITFVTLNKAGRKGSCGLPISLYEIKILGEDGQEAADGVAGEIVARERQKGLGFLGYFRNPEAEKEAMVDGWFHTGDLARRDADGFLFYAGRKKDMVRRRGINISSWEVEQVVNKFANVAESALVPVPSDLGEDDLKIVVRTADNTTFDPLDLIRFCETRMPYYQVPRYVEFIDEFPKTPTQRIRKALLSREVDTVWDLDATGHKVQR